MSITITTSTLLGGADDVRHPHLPPWERVSDEATDVRASRNPLRSIGL